MRCRNAGGTWRRIAPTSTAVFANVRPAPAAPPPVPASFRWGRAPAPARWRARHAPPPLRDRRGGRAGMKAHAPHAERRRALELFRQSGPGAHVLVVLRRCRVQNVGRVHDHELRIDARLGEGGAKAVDALRFDGNAIAVVAGDGGEGLHRAHVRRARATRRHVNPAVIDRVCAVVVGHVSVIEVVRHARRDSVDHRPPLRVEISDNAFAGIWIANGTTRTTVAYNRVRGGGDGIALEESPENGVTGNRISEAASPASTSPRAPTGTGSTAT